MTKPTPEEIMAAAVVTARESCGLSRSELGRDLEQAGLPKSSAWRFDHLGRVSATEQAALVDILTKRREDLARKAASAQAALDALAKITPTVTATEAEEEPTTEPAPKPAPAKKTPPKAPAKRAPRKAAATS